MRPVHQIHSHMSTNGACLWSAAGADVVEDDQHDQEDARTAIHVGWNRSGKFSLLNDVNR